MQREEELLLVFLNPYPPPPYLPSLYIGLGQREAQNNHERLFNHAYQRSHFFSSQRINSLHCWLHWAVPLHY